MMSTDETIFLAFIAFVVALIGFAVRKTIKTRNVHRGFRDQLKSKYNLTLGRVFSVTTRDQRNIWFGLGDRNYANGASIHGTSFEGASSTHSYILCGVTIDKKIDNLCSFDFLVTHKDESVRVKNSQSFVPVKQAEFGKKAADKFYIASAKELLTLDEIAQLQPRLDALLVALDDTARFEVNYINGRLTVYVTADPIKNFDELDSTFNKAMECMDSVIDVNQLRRAA